MTPLSILIVDDEKLNLDVLNHFLADQYEIYAARSGKTALKLAAANRPDLILLDIVMPEMNGYEVLVRLKETEETSRIPVVVITSLDCAENEEKGLRLGAADYITKPFNGAIVKARVQSLMKIVRQRRSFESQGMIDDLTGLPNRKYFELQCRIEWLRAIRNNALLHLLTIEVVGPLPDDRQIRIVADLLRKVLTSYPSGFAARIDPIRFGFLLCGVAASLASALAIEIRDRFQDAPLFSASGERLITCIERFSITATPENFIGDLLERVRPQP